MVEAGVLRWQLPVLRLRQEAAPPGLRVGQIFLRFDYGSKGVSNDELRTARRQLSGRLPDLQQCPKRSLNTTLLRQACHRPTRQGRLRQIQSYVFAQPYWIGS